MLSSSGGEKRNTFAALERTMLSAGVTWTDIGDSVEHDGDGKYTDAEMAEFAQAARAEGVEDGIKIGAARASNGNGHAKCFTLPEPREMAEYCNDRPHQLDAKQRDFIDDMCRRRRSLTPNQLGWLVHIYIQIGGRSA